MALKVITVQTDQGERRKRLGTQDGYKRLLSEFAISFLKDADGIEIEDFESLVDGYKYELGPPEQQQQDQQQQPIGGEILSEIQALRLEVHGVRETLPSVLIGHVLTPSQASRIPHVVSSVFDSLGLSLSPESNGATYKLPDECGGEWKFNWKWPNISGGSDDDRVLERQSYGPVTDYLAKIGLISVDVSEGQFCVEKLLFNVDVYIKRIYNPMLVRGQTAYLRHRVQGRTDIAVLRKDNKGGYILRNMVKFVIELKTVHGYQQTQSGCMHECQLQLIGLNAFNTNCSPPVVLSNLARKHQVVFLDADDQWQYAIKVQDCESFAAAIHFANALSERECISQHFSRPTTPNASD